MKKLLCSLLAVVMLIAFCGCGLNANIKEFKISGDEITVESLQEWFEVQEKLEEEQEKDGKLAKSQWYSVDIKMAMEASEGEEYENFYSKVNGKVYVTPFAYEAKAKISGETKSESASLGENEKLEKSSSSMKINAVTVNGETFTKTSSVGKDDYGKSESIMYNREYAEEDVLGDLMDEFDIDIGDIVEGLDGENGKIYKKNNGISIEYEQTENDNSAKMVAQVIIEYKKNSTELKRMCYYLMNESSITVEGKTIKTKTIIKMEIKTALFGASVKRPSDYYKYTGIN